MDTNITKNLPAIGSPFGGGTCAGFITMAGVAYALVVAPKDGGERESEWNGARDRVTGAQSYFDGLANTAAMADAGSDLAKWARALSIGGFTDWYIPARDELEVLYRAFKPTSEENDVWRHGDNPSSIPVGYPYTEAAPAQTSIESFRGGSPEAFEGEWYWSSTQYAGYEAYAWGQSFSDGYQNLNHKDDPCRARAVRRLPI